MELDAPLQLVLTGTHREGMAPRHAQTGTAGLGLRLGLALALALAFAFGSRLRLRLRVGVRVGSWLCRARLLRLLRARLAAPGGSRHLGPKAGPLGAQPLPWARELAASKAANTTAFDHSGGGQGPGGAPYQGGDRGLQSTHTPAARAVRAATPPPYGAPPPGYGGGPPPGYGGGPPPYGYGAPPPGSNPCPNPQP